jgi:DNA-binding LytR/AlgR family response regulator
MELSIGVCEDDTICQKKTARMVKNCLEGRGHQLEIRLFENAEELLQVNDMFDMLFMDIEMGGAVNGIEAGRRIHDKYSDTIIFFITNYSVYLDQAFQIQAFRYLQKPLDKERLEEGISYAVKKIKDADAVIQVTATESKSEIKFRLRNILYLAVADRKTKLITKKGEFLVEEPLKNLKEQIGTMADYFCETHTSYYVNVNYVKSYTRDEAILEYAGKEYVVYMSRRKYSEFERKFFMLAGDCI